MLGQKKLRTAIIMPLARKRLRRIEIAFANNAKFHANGESCNENTQQNMNSCTKYYEATRGRIQDEKVMHYAQE